MAKALKVAIESNDPSAVQKALKSVKDVNRRMPGTSTPLLYACEKGSAKVLDVLLEAGAVAEKKNSYAGDSPFAIAAAQGHTATMKRLLELGHASPEAVEHALEDAAMQGRDEVVRFIIARGGRNAPIAARLFRLATTSDRTGATIDALIDCGGDINCREEGDSEQGTTALHFVAGDPEKMRLLAERGADVNARDARGRTPLMRLAANLEWNERSESEADAIKGLAALLDLGADAHLTDQDGNDALAYYEFEARHAESGLNHRLVQLLERAGARGSGATGRLFAAIGDNDLSAAKAALRDGAEVNHVAPKGGTPLLWTRDNTLAIAKVLLAAGADPNKPGLDTTPLISAARCGDLELVKLLVEAGANIHTLDANRKYATNAYRAAEIAGEYEIVDYLKSLGASRPKPAHYEPIKPGVASWNDFSELLVNADGATVAQALADLIQGAAHHDVYGQSFVPGAKAYVVLRPRGMNWCNVFQVAPPPLRFEDEKKTGTLARELAKTTGGSVLQIEYSDTADAASVRRFEPDGSGTRDAGWDREMIEEFVEASGKNSPAWARKLLRNSDGEELSSTERLVRLAENEKFVAAAFGFDCVPGRKIEVDLAEYPAEAFTGVAFVTN